MATAKKPKRTRANATRNEPKPRSMGEARPLYVASEDEDKADDTPLRRATTRLSSKNQITLPVKMVRALGLKPGDEVDLYQVGREVVLDRRPKTPKEWVERTMGSLAHVPEWQTKEGIDEYIRRERDSWDREWDRDESS